MLLAVDTGRVPQQIGAVLLLDGGPDFDVAAAAALVTDRVRAIPRLRQRLETVPPGCGRPIWVDDAGFDPARHVRRLSCPAPGDERALLDLATALVTERLPATRPLWSAVLVTGLTDGAAALIVVLHHVLADGIGGLAVLATLVDQAARPAPAPSPATVPAPATFPAPPPSRVRLAVDAFRSRVRALSRLGSTWRVMRRSVAAMGGLHPAAVTPCSLLRKTGPRRQVAVIRADLGAVRDAAHRQGATVNDAVLTAVAGGLHALLRSRGESVDPLVVTVPVAGRRSTTPTDLGNQVGPMPVTLPVTGDPACRIRQVAATMRAHKATAAGPPAAALLGPVFRTAAALGLYDRYLNHQRRFHTLVTTVHGPDRPVRFGGATVRDIVPLAVGESGNVTVSFDVLTYAGTLIITAVADPDRVPDLSSLVAAVRTELAALTLSRAPACF
jgi:WS/DGAT/MGAT family acyltransferase